jgi:hypothetical protein
VSSTFSTPVNHFIVLRIRRTGKEAYGNMQAPSSKDSFLYSRIFTRADKGTIINHFHVMLEISR